jgi:putative transcriptional regulator
MEIKNNIRKYRLLKDMTQSELAEKANVTRQTIGLIEGGGYNPTINLCLKISQVLNVTLDDLFLNDFNINK